MTRASQVELLLSISSIFLAIQMKMCLTLARLVPEYLIDLSPWNDLYQPIAVCPHHGTNQVSQMEFFSHHSTNRASQVELFLAMIKM